MFLYFSIIFCKLFSLLFLSKAIDFIIHNFKLIFSGYPDLRKLFKVFVNCLILSIKTINSFVNFSLVIVSSFSFCFNKLEFVLEINILFFSSSISFKLTIVNLFLLFI